MTHGCNTAVVSPAAMFYRGSAATGITTTATAAVTTARALAASTSEKDGSSATAGNTIRATSDAAVAVSALTAAGTEVRDTLTGPTTPAQLWTPGASGSVRRSRTNPPVLGLHFELDMSIQNGAPNKGIYSVPHTVCHIQCHEIRTSQGEVTRNH